jgi:hypothetical protein
MPWWWPFGQGASGASGSGGERPPPPPTWWPWRSKAGLRHQRVSDMPNWRPPQGPAPPPPPPPPEQPPPVWRGGEILVSPSRKLHPEIDYEELARGYIASGLDQQLAGGRNCPGEFVTSPYDLFAIETVRDQYGMRTGRAIPTDVFVLGKGEAPRRDGTKFGGLPYWPADRPWPMDTDGYPCRFLAQFNFADSHDLFPSLPGEVLLIFTCHDDWPLMIPLAVHFEWLPLGLEPIASISPELLDFPQAVFYGAIHRTADYPDADSAGKLPRYETDRLRIIYGLKIGGWPYPIQDYYDDATCEKLLCQISVLGCTTGVPYPWVNQRAGVTSSSTDASDWMEWKSDAYDLSDGGILLVFLEEDGLLSCNFDMY